MFLMHYGVCVQEVLIPRAIGRNVRTVLVYCDNKPRQTGINHDYNTAV